ncbi:MAG TPA: response regulator [Candidatus Obscuribacterales bacterium]
MAAALLMCLVSAGIGPLSLCATGMVPWALYSQMGFTWWLGDVTGVLLVAPVLLLWSQGPVAWSLRGWGERLLALTALLLLSQLSFGGWFHGWLYVSQPYLLLPPLLWIVFYFGAREAVLGIAVVSGVAIWNTLHGMGPFVRDSLNDSLLLLQMFMGIVAMTLLVLAAALNERTVPPPAQVPPPARSQPLWFPLVLSFGLSLISLVLGLALHAQEQNQLTQTVQTQLKNTHQLIRLHLDTRILALLRMGKRWEAHGSVSRQEWENEAWAYYHDFKSFHRLSWIDAGMHVRWGVPARGAEEEMGRYLGDDPIRRPALEAARWSHRFAVTETLGISGGEKGFVVYVPVFHGNQVLGYIAGVFGYQELLQQLLGQGVGTDYAFEVRHDKQILYQHGQGEGYAPAWAEESVLKLHGISWLIRIWPSHELIGQQLSPLPQITALVGILLAALLGWTTYLSRRMREQNLSIQANNVRLSAEISERQRTEAALRESRDKWQALIDQIKDAVLIADFDSAYFLEANPQACELFGYSPETFRQLKGRHLTAPEGHDISTAFSEDLHRMRFAQNPAMPLITSSGERFWGDLRATVFEVGERKLIVNVIRDVTARVNTEHELLKAKKYAEEASQAKGDFLANMSHEIRTPLNAIIGLNHLLLRTALNGQQQDYVRNNQQAARNLLGLINDILDVSKIEAGMLELESASFELQHVLQHLFNLLSRQAQEKGLELLVRLPGGLPEAYVGDRLRLEQVLVNLLGNAIKFTPAGEVELAIGLLEQTADRVHLAFSVSDTGIGISPGQGAHLFQAFSQADSSITRRYGGSGLGLTISRHLVSLMGGTLSFRSEPGQGSCFSFDAWFSRAGAAPAEPTKLPGLSSLRALAIDDHPRALEILAGYLRDFGLVTDTWLLQAGASAAELPGCDYDVVLLDWPLPQADLARLQPLGARQSGLLLMLGDGAELPDLTAHGLEIGGLLVKPVTPVQLQEALRGLFAPPDEAAAAPELSLEQLYAQRLRPFAGARILLVEDNRINQRVAQELLAAQGFIVDIANHGEEALDCLAAQDYDLVLMDLQMPIMDGFAATEAIRAQTRYQELPIVAMTADVIAGTREKALRAGMNDYVSKPIELSTLYKVLLHWLGGSESDALPVLPAMPAIPAIAGLPPLEALAVTETLQRLGGNLGFYLELLSDFEASLPQQLEDLAAALAHTDHDIASYLAHSLKGMAANLGAVPLQQALQALELALRSDQDPRPAWQACESAATALREQLPLLTKQKNSEQLTVNS